MRDRDSFTIVATEMIDMRTFLVLSFLLSGCVTGNLLSTDKTLPLIVESGRSSFLTKAQLPIDPKLNKADICQVEVDDVQPLASTVGFIKPKKFPCFFKPESVSYQHEGSPLKSVDTVMLNIYFFRKHFSAVQNVTIHITIIPPKAPSRVNLRSSLTVRSSKGVSEALSSKVLTVQFDFKKEFCRIRHFNQDAASIKVQPWMATRYWPLTGLLITFNKSKVFEFNLDCQQALLMGYRFMHRKSRGPSVDFLPLIIEVSSIDTKEVIDTTYLHIPIIIASTSADLFQNLLPPPIIETFRTIQLKNSGGSISLLPKDILEVRSQDKERGPLIAEIVSIQGNDVATFVNMRDPSKHLRSFILSDLTEGLIGFQLLSYSETSDKVFRVDLIIHDCYFVQSEPVILKIVDVLDNKNQPFLVYVKPFFTYTSNLRHITYDTIQIVGQRDHNLIKYRLVNVNTTFGSFMKNSKALSSSKKNENNVYFNMEDIKNNQIFYKHNGGLENVELIKMEASIDRFRFIRFYLPIFIVRVYARSKEVLLAPSIEFLTPTEGIMPLSLPKMVNWVFFHNLQKDNLEVYFSVSKEPRFGSLIKIFPWENVTSTSVFKKPFSLQDLLNGLIYFKSSPSGSNSRDVVGIQQIGRLGSSTSKLIFNIRIYVNNFLIRRMDPNVVFKVLETSQFAKLSYLNLNFVNNNLQPYDVVYRITRCPTYQKMNWSIDSGRLVSLKSIQNHLLIGDTVLTTKITNYRSAQITSVTSFTQQQVLDNDIVYIPPTDDVGPRDHQIQFLYSVKDSYGYEIRNVPFTILVQAVNNQPPFVKTSGMTIPRDEEAYLTSENVEIGDIDTNMEDLSVEIIKLPTYGRLLDQKNVVITGGWKGSPEQFAGKNLRYKHGGQNVKEDRFKIRVFDKVQYSPITEVLINITKRIISNSSWDFYINNSIIVKENLTVTLHQNALQNVMKDFDFSSFSNPTFILVSMPTRGSLMKDNNAISSFNYAEIKSGHIRYKHTPVEIGSKDQFDFTQIWILETGLSFNINFTILPVNSQSPSIFSQTPLQINEGGFGIISYYTLGVIDVDSKETDLMIKVIRPPLWGKIYMTSNKVPITTFSTADIRLGKVLYVNDKYSNGLEQTNDVFAVQAFDGDFSSPLQEISIVIHPTNDEIPKLVLKNFNIAIGENRTLNDNVFQVSDADIPRDPLQISVTQFPRYGNLSTLYRHGEINVLTKNSPPLTLQMLKFVSILYFQNKRSLNLKIIKFPIKDEFVLTATDGKHKISQRCVVNITGYNVYPPVIFTSLIQMNQVVEKNITTLELYVKDDDTLPEDIVFTLVRPPQNGNILLSGVEVKLNQMFTQKNINEEKVRYKYTGGAVTYTKDSFIIKVTDGSVVSKPKNVFLFLTQPIQKPKMIVTIENLKVEIGRRFVLDRSHFKIKNSKPDIISSLIVTLKRKPTCGSLYYFTNLQEPVMKFLFDDVEKRKILIFIPECPEVVKSMTIPISIFHPQMSPQLVNIKVQIIPRSNLPPTLEKNDPIEALVGSNVLLTKDKLLITDQDTASDKINFRYLKNNGSFILLLVNDIESEIFTQYDLNSQRVVISIPDNITASKEVLRLQVTDGYNEGFLLNSNLQRTGILEFSVILSQWIHKDLILMRFSAPREMKFIDGYNAFQWTFNHLLVSRPDARIESAIDLVVGFFFNIKTKQSLKTFTQIDINKGWIYYFLHKERSAMVYKEIFQFKIYFEEFRISSESLTVNWSIIEFDKTKYKLCAQRGLLSIDVVRKGDLSVESQALVGFVSKEAVIDQDFRLMSQRLLIFSPGQRNNTISISILLSGSVKSPSRFHVTLKSPKQAVVGEKSTTVVSIKERNNCGIRKYFLPERTFKHSNDNIQIQEDKDMIRDVNLDSENMQERHYLPSSDQLEVQYVDYISKRRAINKCQKGWKDYFRRCYLFFDKRVTWTTANSRCNRMNAYMISVPSEDHLQWLVSQFGKSKSFWIGLHRSDGSDEWKYPNNEAIMYAIWDEDFPKRSGRKHKDCVIVTKRRRWRNRPCSKQRSSFICMKNPQVLI